MCGLWKNLLLDTHEAAAAVAVAAAEKQNWLRLANATRQVGLVLIHISESQQQPAIATAEKLCNCEFSTENVHTKSFGSQNVVDGSVAKLRSAST